MIDIVRSPGAPAALSRQIDGCWRQPEVLARLHADFRGKCYLCERPVAPGAFEVDHRVPQRFDPSRRFDWENLFVACKDCNNRRARSWPPAGLLSPGMGVEARLVQEADPAHSPLVPVFEPLDSADAMATHAAAELRHLHLDPGAKAAALREAIRDRVLQALWAWSQLQSAPTDPARIGEFRRMVSRNSPFTMLVRSVFSRMAPADRDRAVALFD